MAIFSPLRSRRFAKRQSEVTLHLIAFTLRQEWFALPIASVVKVVPLGNVYGDPQHQGIAVTVYQGVELLVLDVGHRIFQDSPSLDLATGAHYLLIVQNAATEMVGIPLESPPTLRRLPESAFKPLPDSYINYGNIKCVSELVVEESDQPALFLLNPELLKVNF